MAIHVKHTPYEAIGKAASLIGKAKADQRAGEIAQRYAMEAMRQDKALEQQMQMAQFRQELDFKAQQQAEAWEVQKMQMRSQNDFELAEYKNQVKAMQAINDEVKEIAEYNAAKKAITESNFLNDSEKQKALLQLDMKKLYGLTGVLPTQTAERQLSPNQLIAMSKYLEEAKEPAWYQPFAKGPSPETKLIAEQFKEQITGYQIGQIVYQDGIPHRITGFEEDGTPIGEPI